MSLIAACTVPPSTYERLAQWCKSGQGEPGYFFRPQARPKLLMLLWLIAGVLGLGSGLLAFALLSDPATSAADRTPAIVILAAVTAPSSLYFLVTSLELARASRSRLRPFTLISPVEIVAGDYDHGMLRLYRLSDATEFSTVHEYGFGQRYKGLRYKFTFPSGAFSLLVPNRRDEGMLDAVLAEARHLRNDPHAKKVASGTYAIFPDGAETSAKPSFAGGIWRPFSEFWIGVGAIYLIGFAVLLLFSRRR
jgi:hypothetical protein